MKSQEELERIIEHYKFYIGGGLDCLSQTIYDNTLQRALQINKQKEELGDVFNNLISKILSAGYVKLSDVELDEEKIFETLFPFFNLVANNTDYPEKILQKMSIIIAQSAKEIVKVNQ